MSCQPEVAPQRALPPAAARGRRTRAAQLREPGTSRQRRRGRLAAAVGPVVTGGHGLRHGPRVPAGSDGPAPHPGPCARPGRPPHYRYWPVPAAHALGQALRRAPVPGGQPAPHLLQLRPRRHLLGEQRRLDALEQALQPADQLGLRDPQLGVAGGGVVGERRAQPVQLVAQLRRQALLQLATELDRMLRSRAGRRRPAGRSAPPRAAA